MDLQSIKNRFGIIGNTSAINHALNTAAQVANTDLTVLITGESGVGKEAFSQVIHALSSRKHNPFIAVNCGAIPEGTIDSELFGHEKGAFTGAVDSRKGYFETVNGGTLFLDEIGEMPLSTQARLLRVLESGEFIRVGSSKVQKTDVRVIGATNRDLLQLAQQRKFREDLYYRLSTVPIKVPPLRERIEDIPLLFRKFALDFAEKYRMQSVQLTSDAVQLLQQYPWPGNVRELKNIAEQISVLSTDKMINADVLRPYLQIKETNTALMLSPNNLGQNNNGPELNATERDILYKLFFDLKKDMNDLKKYIFETANQQGMVNTNIYNADNFIPASPAHNFNADTYNPNMAPLPSPERPVFITPSSHTIEHHEEVEEILSLADREKEFIIKALKKHNRKIKEYNIAE
jgi:transcriptional regulator with GAF, ATPase, and Fis domain